jgi:flagellar motility protein MotE (MotC chaperone)
VIEDECTKEEIVVLRELRERSELLDLRSAGLDEREGAIEDAEHLLATRLAKIESIRADIVGKLDAERSMILATIREEQTSRRKEIEKEQSARLKKIEEEQAIVLAAIARDQKVKAERVLELAGIVATMKSKAAAAMLAGMDENIALQVLLQLRPKTAGKIMAAMPATTAQSLGDQMTVYKDPRRALGGSAGSAGGSRSADDDIPPPAVPPHLLVLLRTLLELPPRTTRRILCLPTQWDAGPVWSFRRPINKRVMPPQPRTARSSTRS